VEPHPTVRRSHRRRPESRSALVVGLVVVLLATVPVLVPLLVTRGDGTSVAGPPGSAAQPGAPALPRSGEGAEPGPAPTTAMAAPAPAGSLVPAPAPATSSPSASPPPAAPAAPAPEPEPAPESTSSTTAPTSSAPPPAALVAAPDLVVVSVSWAPAPPTAGQPVTFAAVVRNAGTEVTPEVTHGVGFTVDGTSVSWSSADSAPLAPGEERTYTADGGPAGASWTATTGEHELQAYVDDVDRIGETDDGNNTLSTTLTVP
jgi:CARDB